MYDWSAIAQLSDESYLGLFSFVMVLILYQDYGALVELARAA